MLGGKVMVLEEIATVMLILTGLIAFAFLIAQIYA